MQSVHCIRATSGQRRKLMSQLFCLRFQIDDLLFGTVGLRLGLLRNFNAVHACLILRFAQIGQTLIVIHFVLQNILQGKIGLQRIIG
ncbi:hypothetical protein D3C80_1903920 [compost metagenome]